MIVVIGSPILRLGGLSSFGAAAAVPGGLAAEIALAAAAAGALVQLVGKLGDDDSGDAVLVALAAAGVKHAATLRDPSSATPRWDGPAADESEVEGPLSGDEPDDTPTSGLPAGLPLEAADVEPALRYLTDFGVVVLAADLDPAAIRAVLDAAAYVGAHVIRFDRGTDDAAGGAGDAAGGAGDAGGGPGDAAEGGAPEVTVVAPPSGTTAAFAAVIGRYAAGLDGGQPPDRAFREAVRATDWEPSRG